MANEKIAPMLPDRRRVQRHTVGCPAKIKLDQTARECDCVVADLSQEGIRVVAPRIDVPEEFTLLLDGAASRTCSVVWPLDDEIGAEFADAAEDGWLDAALNRLNQVETMHLLNLRMQHLGISELAIGVSVAIQALRRHS